MIKYIVQGGTKLSGSVTISGAKNAAVAILPATLLVSGPCRIENVPDISDVRLLLEILRDMGAEIRRYGRNTLEIDCTRARNATAPIELVRRIRASYYLIGAELGRFGHAHVAMPGGCNFGVRPIDQHIKGMRALGAEVHVDEEAHLLTARAAKLRGAEIFFDVVSVGATINVMLAACRAEGQTVLTGVAKEPHVVDVANFLNMMGASVRGAGTDVIRISGREKLHGCGYAVIPDQIETGTFMIAAAATGGDVVIKNVIPTHMEATSAKLMESGARVIEGDDGRDFYLRVVMDGRPRPVNIKTMVYPGFPTDLQQPMMAYLSTAAGVSTVTENIFENRFNHVRELRRMGASISLRERVARIKGVNALRGAQIYASDLRAGAALIIAGLMASGRTQVHNIEFIDRGYEYLDQKLTALGASIRREAR